MNNIMIVFALVLLLNVSYILALPTSDSDRSINELYENLLQREYTGPISLSDHQVERKAVRSPSLRLRFGRSDPNISPLEDNRINLEKINQKSIRSPSMRLRFGKRNDQLMSMIVENLRNEEIGHESDNEKEKRKPSGRLRWGRTDPEMKVFEESQRPHAENKNIGRLLWEQSNNNEQADEDEVLY